MFHAIDESLDGSRLQFGQRHRADDPAHAIEDHRIGILQHLRGTRSADPNHARCAEALDLIEHALILAPVAAPRVEHYDGRLAIRIRKESG